MVTPEAMAAYTRHRAEIAGILDERFFPLWWVESQISAGHIGLVHSDSAVIGVEVRNYPGGAKELHGMFAAGDKDAIRALVVQVCEAAADMGCHVAAIESRPGWAREFRNLSFQTDRVRIVKDLADGAE